MSAISQQSFVEQHAPTWTRFEETLSEIEKDRTALPAEAFPEQYREICNHLSIAKHRGYSVGVTTRLNRLVERGHTLLYGARVSRQDVILDYITAGFARQIRAEWKLLLLSTAFFVIPALAMFFWLTTEPDWTYHVLGSRQMVSMEAMYEQPTSMRVDRESDSDVLMFGYYIRNNTGIGLRTFASGLVFGIGSLFVIAFNGIFMGAVAAHLHNAELSQNLWPFIIGHGSFELTAIVLAGMTGFKLGFAPIWPGRLSRMDALRKSARDNVGLVAGFAAMFIIAAFIEAFWSSSTASDATKYTVGTFLWLFVIAYFVFAGRDFSTSTTPEPAATEPTDNQQVQA